MALKQILGRGGETLIVIAALVVEILMGLFPPWRVTIPGEGFNVSVGYYLIFSPPNPAASVDLGRLIVQWVVVGLIAAIVIIIVRMGTKG